MNEGLVREMIDEKIIQVVFELGALKAPRPDGYNGVFYQKYQKIVKESVIKEVQVFFFSGYLLRELNRIKIIPIPKVKKPEKV